MSIEVERRLLHLAAEQHGVFTLRQWLELGLADTTLRRRAAQGRYTALGEGAFAVSGLPISVRSRLMAATLVVPYAIASHESAAELHDLPLVDRGRVVVMTGHIHSNKSRLARVRRTSHLAPADCATIDAIPVTSLTRTVLDLCRVIGAKRLTAVVDHVLAHGHVSREELFAAFDVYARPGRPRIRFLRRVLEPFATLDGVPHSLLERALVDLVSDAGLPAPTLQFRLPWRHQVEGIADLAWPAYRVIVEADGRRWHTRTQDFERDRQRDNVAQAHGWRVLRFTHDVLVHRRIEVLALLRPCLKAPDGTSSSPSSSPPGWH